MNLINLRELLKTILNETRPIEDHTDPRAINDCWNTVFEELQRQQEEAVALKAMLKYIEFEVTSKCCPVCGGNQYHDVACVLAAFLYDERAESYKYHTKDTHINEMLFKVWNVKKFSFLVEPLNQACGLPSKQDAE